MRVNVVVGKFQPVRAVELFQHLWGERLFRRAVRAHVVVDAENPVESLGDVREIVRGYDYDLALVSKDCRTTIMSSWAATSTPLKASSIRMMLASWASARAMNTLWR